MSKITSFQVVDHGIEHAQDFQGCGTAFTDYDECVTGCGDNAIEALEDAFESAAQFDVQFTDEQRESMLAELTSTDSQTVREYYDAEGYKNDDLDGELNYYVSIRYSIEPSEVAK